LSAHVSTGRSRWPADLLDRALDEPVLVIGSVPPEGNDLDLLVRPDQERVLGEILTRADFVCRAIAPFRGYPRGFRIWARFRECNAHTVDEIPVGDLELPPEESARLFAEARPIPGFARLLRPSPRHVLLRLAHDYLDPEDSRAPLSASRRRRVLRALAEEPAAWELAAELAPSWASTERLARLRAAFDLGEAASAAPRRSSPLGTIREYRRAWRSGRLIAFSGPDDARRSGQAEGLQRALDGLDIPARLMRIGPARSSLFGAARQLQLAALPGLRAGEVVICDRYVLDAAVALRLRRRLKWHTSVLRFLVPPPRRAYLIDSPAPHAGLFRERSAILGVRQVDGTRAPEHLCAEIALDVWEAVR